MGLCVSVKNDADIAAQSRSVRSSVQKPSIPSPVKDKSAVVNGGNPAVDDVPLTSLHSPGRFTAAGSKEEAFFDSQPWVESDGEDDYFSVRGDFTPSCASTPVHHFSQIKTPLPEEEAMDAAQASSPPQEQKSQSRLLDLFNDDKQAPTKVEGDAIPNPSVAQEPKSRSGGSSFSFSCRSDDNASTGNAQRLEIESPKSALRCLPRRSSSGRRKRTSWIKKQNSG